MSPTSADFSWSRLLTFLQELAGLLGRGLAHLLRLVLPREVAPELVLPLGYLALLTLVLFVFQILAAARKVIWLGVGIGWILLLIRILVDAFA
ncbi:MAG: hypothetical protein ABDI20_03265 [Candidatus Bipolaricaulaceae bacterium]